MDRGENNRARKECGRHERGSVIIEFATTIPLIVTTLFTMLDLGFCLNEYLKISRIAYEGARYASTIAGLEEESNVSDSQNLSFITSATNQHAKVHTRIQTLLERNSLPNDLSEISIRTEYGLNGTPSGSPLTAHTIPRVIRVRLDVPYHPIFPMYPTLRMVVTRSGPYLYRPKV